MSKSDPIHLSRPRRPGDPVRPVEVVKEGLPRSHKLKMRRLDSEYEGLEEWVPEVRLCALGRGRDVTRERVAGVWALDIRGVYGMVAYDAVKDYHKRFAFCGRP